jgi:hypothetical protein
MKGVFSFHTRIQFFGVFSMTRVIRSFCGTLNIKLTFRVGHCGWDDGGPKGALRSDEQIGLWHDSDPTWTERGENLPVFMVYLMTRGPRRKCI